MVTPQLAAGSFIFGNLKTLQRASSLHLTLPLRIPISTPQCNARVADSLY